MKKEFPTFIDEHCLEFEYIYVSAGKRGLQVKIAPKDLVEFSKAKTCLLFNSETL